jgi:hypothetical protein
MKTSEEMKVYLHAFLNSALDVGKCSASRRGYFASDERQLPLPKIPIGCVIGYLSKLVYVLQGREKSVPLPGIEQRS